MFVVLVRYLERYSSSMMLISIISKACLLASVYITEHDVGLSSKEMGMNFSPYVNERKQKCSV